MKKTYELAFMLCFGILFLVSLTSATWSNSTFNNSLTSENLTFTGNQNFTRWLQVPQNIYVFNGFLNLSGFLYPNSLLTNEVHIDGNGGEYCSGSYSGTCPADLIDNNWSTSVWTQTGQIAEWYINETTINPQIISNLKLKFKGGVGSTGILNIDCFNGTTWVEIIHLPAYSTTTAIREHSIDYYCYNNSLIQIRGYSTSGGILGGVYYEGNLTWTNMTYPTNSSLFINPSQAWSYSGEFNQTNNKTSNLSSFINSYLNSCSFVSGYCYVPFIFHSDSAGTLQYSAMQFDDNITNGFVENSQTYSASTYETTTESFILNMSYSSSEWSSISGNLIYNGTSYLGTKSGSGNNLLFTKSLTIPEINTTTNKTFYWTIYLTNSSGTFAYNSTSHNQTVQNITFTQCSATYPVTFVNYSIYDETSLALINSSFVATFTYRIGSGESSTYSFSSSADNTSFAFCTNANETFYVDSIIRIEASDYNERTYSFNDEEFTNSTTYKSLYLSNSSISTSVIIEVRDAGLTPLEGYFVTIERYYPETGAYATIISDTTDEFGQFVASLIENTVKYRFTFYDENNVLKKQTGNVIIACKSSICIVPFVIESVGTEFDEFENITDYEYSLSFDNTTNIFTFSWNDLTGESATTRLEVTRYLMNGTTIVCNTTSTSASSSLTCDVGDSEANYGAQAFRSVSGDERRIAVLTIEVGGHISTYGVETLLWVFILLFTLIGIGAFNPTAGVALYGVGFIAFGTLGLIHMPISVFFANTLLVIVFLWVVNKR